MKKILSYILIFTIAFTSALYCSDKNVYAAKNKEPVWPAASSIYGESAILIEASTGTILYEKKANKKMYPASITKIMTALLTIENCSLDETVTFSENAVHSLSYDDANIACQVGEKMSVKESSCIIPIYRKYCTKSRRFSCFRCVRLKKIYKTALRLQMPALCSLFCTHSSSPQILLEKTTR